MVQNYGIGEYFSVKSAEPIQLKICFLGALFLTFAGGSF